MFYKKSPEQTRVALLSGGSSGEREVSLASGKGALKALQQAGYIVTSLDPSEKSDLHALIDGDFDVAFLCLHGRKGEDGALQGFLEMIDLPYTGSDVWASALAIDKGKAKRFYLDDGLLTPKSQLLLQDEPYDVSLITQDLGEKCVVKPAKEGSTLGIRITETASELDEAIQEAFTFDDSVLIERFVEGTELTVVVLGTKDARALPIIEIIPQNGFYDFEAKYAPGGSQHICPARLDDETSARIHSFAERAHRALGCSGVSRTDFILDEDGNAWVLETNTLPGMTETSLLPDAARAAGISFPELCKMLIEDALETHWSKTLSRR